MSDLQVQYKPNNFILCILCGDNVTNYYTCQLYALFWRVFKVAKIDYQLRHVRPYRTARLLLGGFSYNLKLSIFRQYSQNIRFIKI
jgi:hypothetical protein